MFFFFNPAGSKTKEGGQGHRLSNTASVPTKSSKPAYSHEANGLREELFSMLHSSDFLFFKS